MEVLKEKVEEEEEAEREEAAERGEKMMRPVEMRREEPPMTQEMLRDLEKKLSEIEIVIPEQPSIIAKDTFDISKLPLSYQSNTLREEHLLQVADNFARQYSHLCPDRVPLFLHPLNECEVPKFVSTTIRPTLMPYPELYNWDSCAQFVSDFLSMVPLPDPLQPHAALLPAPRRRLRCVLRQRLRLAGPVPNGPDAGRVPAHHEARGGDPGGRKGTT